MNKAAFELGAKLAGAWTPLRAGLTHGAMAAVPGAVLGGIAGAEGYDEASDKLKGALKGGVLGGLATGVPVGLASAKVQHDWNNAIWSPKIRDRVMADFSPRMRDRIVREHGKPGATDWIRSRLKVAAPWSALRTGLTHGAVGALPGAALGGIAGALHGVKRPDGTTDRVGGALRGAAVGGLATGAATGAFSGKAQANMNAIASSPARIEKVLSRVAPHNKDLAANVYKQHMAPGATSWVNSAQQAWQARSPAGTF